MLKKRLFVREKFFKSAGFWRTVIRDGLFVIFILSFWREIRLLLNVITWAKFKHQSGPPDIMIIQSYNKVILNFVWLILLYILFVFAASQFVLPVQTNRERWLVFQRLFRYMFHLHGPAVFIDRGFAIADKHEMLNTRPGVAFVDLCSAIVLERQWEPVDTGNDFFSRLRRNHVVQIIWAFIRYLGNRIRNLIHRLLRTQPQNEPLVRIAGPGIVFTDMNEKIRGIADLRKQFRIADIGITTRDGFEMQVPVNVVFSIGDKPEILLVTYQWDESHSSWREAASPDLVQVITLNLAGNKIEKISTGVDHGLDEEDRREIYNYVLTNDPTGQAYSPDYERHDHPPYHFDSDRVFAALYSKAIATDTDSILNWTELPIHVAAEALRNLIADEDYDTLYQINDPGHFPLFERVRSNFKNIMRNQGILSYQFVARKDGKALKPGDNWLPQQLIFNPPQDLKYPKVLRNRGIRVLSSGFSDFTPKHPGVREQLIDNWRVRWDNEEREIAAQADREAAIIIGQARRKEYRELISLLENAYTGTPVQKDALVIRLFQTIEQAILDPKTPTLLPKECMSILVDLHKYLQSGFGNPQKPMSG